MSEVFCPSLGCLIVTSWKLLLVTKWKQNFFFSFSLMPSGINLRGKSYYGSFKH